jgi:TPR repeat protein
MQRNDYILIAILSSLVLFFSAAVGVVAGYLWEADFFGLEVVSAENSESAHKDGAMYLSEIERRDLYNAAMKKLKDGLYQESAVILQKLADDGDAMGLFELSGFYELGLGNIKADAEKAFALCLEAAEKGYGLAMIGVSRYYQNGFGTPPDSVAAFHWIKKAYDLKEPGSATEMGLYYELGSGVERSYYKAAAYYLEDALDGRPEAAANLGRLLCLGPSELRNVQSGMGYLQQAHDAGMTEATVNIGLLKEMSGDIPAAFEFYEKAVADGNFYACYNQARLLQQYFAATGKPGEIFELYFTAAEGGVREALVSLADLLVQKKGNMEYIRRFRLLRPRMREFADQGWSDIQRALADLLLMAEDVFVPDPERARLLYEQAAENEDSFAMYRLGYGHEYNLFAVSSLEKARECYARAVSHNKEPNSAYQLGMMYLKGQGVEKNPLQAYILLRTAIDALGDGVVSSDVIDELKETLSPEQLTLAESLL